MCSLYDNQLTEPHMKKTISIFVSLLFVATYCFGNDDRSVSLGAETASMDTLPAKLDKDVLKELPTQKNGVLILESKEGSNFAKIGGQKFDLITKIGNENIKDVDAFKE